MFHALTAVALLRPAPECLAPLICIDFFEFAPCHLRNKQKLSRSENELIICPAQYEKAMETVPRLPNHSLVRNCGVRLFPDNEAVERLTVQPSVGGCDQEM